MTERTHRLTILAVVIGLMTVSTLCGCKSRSADVSKVRAALDATEGLLVQTQLGPHGMIGPPMEPMVSGILSFEGFTLQRDQRETRGVKVRVVSPHGPDERIPIHASLLDESEARELDAALTKMAQIQAAWVREAPAHDIEIDFRAKDQFSASLYYHEKKDEFGVSSGTEAFVFFPGADIPEVQRNLRAAIASLH